MIMMNKPYLKIILLPLIIISVMFSCKVTKPYKQPVLDTNAPYRDQTITDTATIANLPLETILTDTILRSLIKEGLSQNLNLKIAVQKIAEAQATFGQSKSAILPSLSANAGVTRSKQSAAALDFPQGI